MPDLAATNVSLVNYTTVYFIVSKTKRCCKFWYNVMTSFYMTLYFYMFIAQFIVA